MEEEYIFYKEPIENSYLDVINRFGLQKCEQVIDFYYNDYALEHIAQEVELTVDQVALIIMSNLQAYEEKRADKNFSAYCELYDKVKSFLFHGYNGLKYLANALVNTRKQLHSYDYWNDEELDEEVKKRFS